MFWRLALATCLQLDSVAKIVCFAQMGQFLNVFSFPSNFSNCSLFGLFISLTNPPCVSQKSPLFFIISTSFFKNRYGFSYYPTTFHVCSMWFLHFWVVVEFCDICYSSMGWVYRFAEGVLLILVIWCLLNLYSWLFLRCVSWLCCSVHIILMVECHNDRYLWLCD